jgi:3-methyladenine DNA glycosylase AlkD
VSRPASAAPYDRQVASIEAALRSAGDPLRAAGEKRYLKSDLEFIGVAIPGVRQVIREFLRAQGKLEKEQLIGLVTALWGPVHERRVVAIDLLERHKRLLTPDDIPLIELLLRESRTWAYVDALAAGVAGEMVERYAELNAVLDRWAIDEDFWIRRSALLALLGPIRRGGGDFERFARYADSMLDQSEFFIRKAIGWVLREASKKRPELVYGWLAPRTHRASGVTMREAVKYLPSEQRERLMAAYRDKRPAE